MEWIGRAIQLISANMVIEMTSNDSLHLSETAGFKNRHSAILSYSMFFLFNLHLKIFVCWNYHFTSMTKYYVKEAKKYPLK